MIAISGDELLKRFVAHTLSFWANNKKDFLFFIFLNFHFRFKILHIMEEEDFNKLCRLCRILVTSEEKKKLLKSIEAILEYAKQLDEVKTEGVAPCYTIHETLKSVMREDIPEAPLARELFLADAPSHIGGMIRVPPVFQLDDRHKQ
ncbi:MAG: Asp-tRNA(Asn)/Glu-tRNA(Gln) amidotransferase subunit GatC [Rhabdochlamydiaceae bacterium]